MWTRAEIKQRAKRILKGNYWKAFIVSLIITIVGGSHNHSTSGANGNRVYNKHDMMNGEGLLLFSKIALVVGSIVLLVIVLRIFIGYMIEVGGRKFFIRASEKDSNIGYLGYCFHEGRYLHVLVTMLLRGIYILLWTLLLIIPGIVKSYAYRMVPYILADNPKIGHNRAIELSNQMTKGEKWNMFILDLSFIGWYILGALALGIGVLFVQPYYDATNAELYLVLKENAIADGLTTHEELDILNK